MAQQGALAGIASTLDLLGAARLCMQPGSVQAAPQAQQGTGEDALEPIAQWSALVPKADKSYPDKGLHCSCRPAVQACTAIESLPGLLADRLSVCLSC